MPRAASARSSAPAARLQPEPSEGEEEDLEMAAPPDLPDEADDEELTDELVEESGLDLTDASDLDADNVTADEEFERVLQAPD